MIHVEVDLLAYSIFCLKHNILILSAVSGKREILDFIKRFSLKLTHDVALGFWLQVLKRSRAFELLIDLRLERNST